MDLGTEFFVALAGIVLADLVLAGDNAVVIALAALNLPPALRLRAVVFGAALAIVLRAALTVAAVFLLRGDIPLVQLIGGIALLWIGWHLAVQQEAHHEDSVTQASTLRGAIRTIIIADVVMSIDNVLAVAAFAKDDPWLVVIGLLISIPIIMGGASLLLRLIDRYPAIVWFGAAMIIYVGIELILQEPFIHDHLSQTLQGTGVERMIGITTAALITTTAWLYRRRQVAQAPAVDPTDASELAESAASNSGFMPDETSSDESGGRS